MIKFYKYSFTFNFHIKLQAILLIMFCRHFKLESYSKVHYFKTTLELNSIPETCHKERVRRGWTMRELAYKANVTSYDISDLENGELISKDKIQSILKVLKFK